MAFEICNHELNKSDIKLGQKVYLHDKEKNNIERNIDIILAPDNNYAQHCTAVMCSILLNCDNTSYIRFHILDNNINNQNKEIMNSLKNIRPFEINYYDMTKFDFSQFPLNRKHISVATYYRLFIKELLPQNIERVLYLDCDVIVERDLKELWNIDLTGYLAGVSEDETSIPNLMRTKLKYSDFCFNAGVILFNMNEIRKINFLQECIEYYNQNKYIIELQDQDILNGVFDGRCKKLPLCWNTASPFYISDEWRLTEPLSAKFEAIYNPGIIHYSWIPKPWNIRCKHPLKDEYWKYLCYTPFKNKYKIYKLKLMLYKIVSFIFSYENTGYCVNIKTLGIKIKHRTLKNKFRNIDMKLNQLLYEVYKLTKIH